MGSLAYYVGWLSAAALHGAGHQAPQVFQVAVDRQLRDRVVGRTRFEFAQRDVSSIPTVEHPTRSGSARVSSVAATMLDIAADVERSAGIDNVATVIVELAQAESFDLEAVVRSSRIFPAAASRRIGYILERFGWNELDLTPLRRQARGAVTSSSRLDPTRVDSGPLDPGWMIRVNADVQEAS